MLTPKSLFHKLKKMIRPAHVQAFFSALIVGLLAHGYALMNYIPNWDGFNNLCDPQNKLALGRCFLTYACGLSAYYDMPWLSGLIGLFCIAVTAALIVQVLSLEKRTSCILVGAVLAAFPACTSIFGYSYTSDGYFIAMLCMTIAVYLCQRGMEAIYKCIPAAILVCFAFGCYQAFVTFAIMLLLVWSLKFLLFQMEDAKKGVYKAFLLTWRNVIVSFGCGFILYYVCNLALQNIAGVAAADYQGINELGKATLSISGLVSGMVSCVVDFAYFFLGSVTQISFQMILNLCVFALLLWGLIGWIVKKKVWKTPLRLILVCLCILCMPFGGCTINLLSSGVAYHTLMMGGLCMVYMLLILFLEKEEAPLYQWLSIGVCVLLTWNHVVIANTCYRVEETSVTKSMEIVSDMADTLRDIPESESATNIVVIGKWDDNTHGIYHSDSSIYFPPVMTGFTDGIVMTGPIHFANLFHDYYGYDLRIFDRGTEMEFKKEHESALQAMPDYPDAGSVDVIDGTIVIKLSDGKYRM